MGLILWGAFCLCAAFVGNAAASVFTIPESQLLESSEFGSTAWGPGTLVGRGDGPGESVDFEFAGLGTGGTGVKDNYPVATVYGQTIPSHGNGDFSGFTGYGLSIKNLDDEAIWIQIILNTGFTGPSGIPSSDETNNTFWTSYPAWTYLGAGDSVVINLSFDTSVAYQISDNKVPHTGGGENWPDGGIYAINDFDRAEVSAIGFEIADFSGGNPDAVIRITPDVTELAGIQTETSPEISEPRIEVLPNPGTTFSIRMYLPEAVLATQTPVHAGVYDIHGRLVSSLFAAQAIQCEYELFWDGTDNQSMPCPAGVYFCNIEVADFHKTCKIVIGP
jgi:hypothetical protein